MASFSLSPSVDITESDFTIGVDNFSTSIGGYAGSFEWGPVGYIVNLATTKDLEEQFGLPNDSNAQDWFCAYNFLCYSNYLKCVRVVDDSACNAVGVSDEFSMCTDNGFIGDASFHDDFDTNLTEYNASGITINNVDDFQLRRDSMETVRQAKIIAKYPGSKGNSLKFSMCDGGDAFDLWEYRSFFSGTARKITVDKIYSDGLVLDSDEKLKVAVSTYQRAGKGENPTPVDKANTSFIVDEQSKLKGNFSYGSPYIRDITDMSNIRVDMDVYLPYKGITQKVGKIRSIVNNNTVRLTKALGDDVNIIREMYGVDEAGNSILPEGKNMVMQGHTYIFDTDGEKIPVYHKRKLLFTDPIINGKTVGTLADKGEYFVKWAKTNLESVVIVDGVNYPVVEGKVTINGTTYEVTEQLKGTSVNRYITIDSVQYSVQNKVVTKADPYVKPYILQVPFDVWARDNISKQALTDDPSNFKAEKGTIITPAVLGLGADDNPYSSIEYVIKNQSNGDTIDYVLPTAESSPYGSVKEIHNAFLENTTIRVKDVDYTVSVQFVGKGGEKYRLVNWLGCVETDWDKSAPSFSVEQFYSTLEQDDYIPVVRYEQKYVYGTPVFGVDKSNLYIPADTSFKLDEFKNANVYFQLAETFKNTEYDVSDLSSLVERYGEYAVDSKFVTFTKKEVAKDEQGKVILGKDNEPKQVVTTTVFEIKESVKDGYKYIVVPEYKWDNYEYGLVIKDLLSNKEIYDGDPEQILKTSERLGITINPEDYDKDTDTFNPKILKGFEFSNLYNGKALKPIVKRDIDEVFVDMTAKSIAEYNKNSADALGIMSNNNVFTTAFDDNDTNMFLCYYSDNLYTTTIPINFGVELTKKITRVSGRPSTSAFAAKNGAEQDEVCIVVIDEDGKFTGTIGTVLERYSNLSKCSDGKNSDGANNYWVDVINNESKYIWIPADFCSNSGSFCSKTLTNWGVPAFERGNSENTVFDTMKHQPLTISLDGGFSNPDSITSGNRMDGFECFADPQAVDVNLLIGGVLTESIADYLVDDIVESRRDCVVFLSPPLSTNLNIDPLTKVLQFRNLVNDSTYAIWDSGWKYQYDSYNDTYRYVPLCADIAGLCAKVDADKGCHWSPAGYNRGLIKNVSSLVWNVENKNDRDELYEMGINSVMTVVGTGTLLFGDRTGTTKKTAFREIGIRRWFMKIEKAIANYSKYVLFEFNDAYTRSSFINTVNPYLRAEQGARACQDYIIQCDDKVNTPEVIDAQGFVANFLIKPMHSINFIQLNFAAVATGTSFEEIEL